MGTIRCAPDLQPKGELCPPSSVKIAGASKSHIIRLRNDGVGSGADQNFEMQKHAQLGKSGG
jgi:hypothetical protein